MIEKEMAEILRQRLKLHIEDDFGLQNCWNKEIEILSRDIQQTINFIENKCSDDTFYWISEVFEDVAEVTQSKEFIIAIKNRAEKITDTQKLQNLQKDIIFAENKLIDE